MSTILTAIPASSRVAERTQSKSAKTRLTETLQPLKWQAFLLSLAVLSGLSQQAALRGNLEYAALFGSLAVCELLIGAVRSYGNAR
jgi:hypothetical protein